MTALSFAFTKLNVGNLDSAESFYSSVLGLKHVTRIEGREPGAEFSEVVLSVSGRQDEGAQLILISYQHRPASVPGEAVIGFMVTDLEACVAGVLREGGAVVHSIRTIREHGLQLAYVTDPEGHTMELIQMLAAA